METDYFKTLPLELRSKILSYLDFNDIQSLVFISHYFYDTIRYGPSAVPSVRLPAVAKGTTDFKKSQIQFYMKLVTDNSNHPLYKLELIKERPIYNSINWTLLDYSIICLHLLTPCSHILSLIEVLGPLYSLRELRFGFDTRLQIDKLHCLAELAPNLQVLDIYFYHGLDKEYYSSNKVFENLHTFKISTILRDWFDWFRGDDYSPDSVISSFVKYTPNLVNLSVMGHFFEKEFKPTVKCIELIPNLQSLAIEVPGPNETAYSRELPLINDTNNSLKNLFIKAYSIYAHNAPQSNPLSSVESFYFDGLGCIHALEYYSIGENLKRLYVKPFSDLKDTKRITRLCKQCPNLEDLVVLWFAAPVSWLVKIATVYCKRLKLVSFVIFAKENDNYNIEQLRMVDNIKDIYLFRPIPEYEANWLTDHGFNFYNGSKYGFDIFDREFNGPLFLNA